MFRYLFSLVSLMLIGCADGAIRNTKQFEHPRGASPLWLYADQFEADTCRDGPPELFTADLEGRKVEVLRTHLAAALALSLTHDFRELVFLQHPDGHEGCPMVPFPGIRLDIKLVPNTPRDSRFRESPVLTLIEADGPPSILELRNRAAKLRYEDGRCRQPSENATVCEVTLNDSYLVKGHWHQGQYIFAHKIPAFSTGDPFFIKCDPDGIRCNIRDYLKPGFDYGLEYSTEVTSHRAAANIWVRIRHIAEYYANGGGAEPPEYKR